jgi:hypothetical protein
VGARDERLARAVELERQDGRQRALAELASRDRRHALILDPEATDADKAQAWLGLAGSQEYPWSDEIVRTMTEIGATSTDDRAREVVWIGADTEHRNTLLVAPLIRALADPVPNVREEAADALGHYLDVGGVRARGPRTCGVRAWGESVRASRRTAWRRGPARRGT